MPILQSTEMSDPPSISVHLAIDPPQFIPGCQPTPTLSVTATSHATVPITIFTWGDIFNLSLAQKRKNFTCLDPTTNAPIRMEITKDPKRCGFLVTTASSIPWSLVYPLHLLRRLSYGLAPQIHLAPIQPIYIVLDLMKKRR